MPSPQPDVLVVDDEPKLGAVIARQTATSSCRRALKRLDRIVAGERFDVILCDLCMPSVDDVMFYERLCLVAPEQVELTIIMTGGGFTERAVAFLDCARIPRLEKPFEPGDLRRLVRDRIRRLAGAGQCAVSLGARRAS